MSVTLWGLKARARRWVRMTASLIPLSRYPRSLRVLWLVTSLGLKTRWSSRLVTSLYQSVEGPR